MKRILVSLAIVVLSTLSARATEAFDFRSGDPVEFLALLRKSKGFVTVEGTYREWPARKDMPALVALIRSEEDCAHVVSASSSHLPTKRATVGELVVYLIESFRLGRFPSSLSSDRPVGSDHSLEERRRDIEKWYLTQKGFVKPARDNARDVP